MNLSDILRIPNTDVSSIICIQSDKYVYMKESAITQLAEENHIKDIDALCNYIIESSEMKDPMHETYKLVRDSNNPWILAESYVPKIVDDPVLYEFDVVESVQAIFYELEYAQSHVAPEAKVVNQKISLFLERIIAQLHKVDYDEPKEIQRRIKEVESAINKLKAEKSSIDKKNEVTDGDYRSKIKKEDKDRRIYGVSVLVSTLTGLAASIITSGGIHLGRKVRVKLSDTAKAPKPGDLKKSIIGTGLVSGLNSLNIFSYEAYENTLSSNIALLERTKAFLEKEYDKSLKRAEKKETKKENSVKPKLATESYGSSIQDIMYEIKK